MATVKQKIEASGSLKRIAAITVTVTDGASAGTFVIPRGAVVTEVYRDTPTTIPGIPTTTLLRLGSAANGQEYVADVDLKTQGFSELTIVYALRKAAAASPATIHYTVASVGGTAADQDGSIVLYVEYML